MATVEERNFETELRDAATARGAKVFARPNGHFQIKGTLLVNYWPFAKKSTAYVDATTHGVHGATIAQAVAMAFQPPPLADDHHKDKRGSTGRYGRWRDRRWKEGLRYCHWCGIKMNRVPNHPKQFTLDHVVPLARGGLDNPNNWVGACLTCNHDRGHAMPEMTDIGLQKGVGLAAVPASPTGAKP